MNKSNKNQILTIPNLLSCLRLILIPLFVWRYQTAKTNGEFYQAAAIIALSGLTDLLDGFIARRFKMITELGKVLDPVADKLTLITVFACISFRYKRVWLLLIMTLLKEGFMLIMGLLLLKHNGRKLNGAMWFGKICTAVIYVCIFIFLMVPNMPTAGLNIIVSVCGSIMIFSLVKYIPVFHKLWLEEAAA